MLISYLLFATGMTSPMKVLPGSIPIVGVLNHDILPQGCVSSVQSEVPQPTEQYTEGEFDISTRAY